MFQEIKNLAHAGARIEKNLAKLERLCRQVEQVAQQLQQPNVADGLFNAACYQAKLDIEVITHKIDVLLRSR